MIAALIDHDTSLENGFVPFFETPAAHPIAPIKLALRHNAIIFTSFIVRTAELRYKVIHEEIAYDPEDPDAISKILEVFSQRLERLIRDYPDQWLWAHRRWRRRPGIDYKLNQSALRSSNDYVRWLEQETES